MNLNAEVALVEILELEICSERGSACFFAPVSFSPFLFPPLSEDCSSPAAPII
jgi:hypothetical protein